MHMHLQITMSGGLFVMTSMFVYKRWCNNNNPHALYFLGGEFLNCLCVHVDLKTTSDNGSKEFPFNTFSTLISLIDGSSMILNATNFPSAFQNNVQKYKERKEKNKRVIAKRRNEVKERKKGRRVSTTTTRIVLRTQCSILMKT